MVGVDQRRARADEGGELVHALGGTLGAERNTPVLYLGLQRSATEGALSDPARHHRPRSGGPMEFDVPYLIRHLPALGRGLALTIQVSALAIVFSVFVGLVGASLRVMRLPV